MSTSKHNLITFEKQKLVTSDVKFQRNSTAISRTKLVLHCNLRTKLVLHCNLPNDASTTWFWRSRRWERTWQSEPKDSLPAEDIHGPYRCGTACAGALASLREKDVGPNVRASCGLCF